MGKRGEGRYEMAVQDEDTGNVVLGKKNLSILDNLEQATEPSGQQCHTFLECTKCGVNP